MKNKNTALLLVAHGSRRNQSNDEVKQLAKKIAAEKNCTYSLVEAAFLEIAEPSIVQGLQNCMEMGAQNVTVFPYFLAAGRHVTDDIPSEVKKFTDKNPQVNVVFAEYLGKLDSMPQLILEFLSSP